MYKALRRISLFLCQQAGLEYITPKINHVHAPAGAVAYLAPLILNQDPKLKRQVCCALAQIAKHSVDMAEVVVEAEVFPKILTCLKFPDELVRKHAATVVREVSLTDYDCSVSWCKFWQLPDCDIQWWSDFMCMQLCHAVLCCAVLSCAAPCYAALCCAVHTKPSSDGYALCTHPLLQSVSALQQSLLGQLFGGPPSSILT